MTCVFDAEYEWNRGRHWGSIETSVASPVILHDDPYQEPY